MDLKLPRWETSEDEIQTAPILGKIKTVLGGKLRVGINHVKLGTHQNPATQKPKVRSAGTEQYKQEYVTLFLFHLCSIRLYKD